MNVKTSLSLPKDLLKDIDEQSGEFGGRSRLVEAALRFFLERRKLTVKQGDLDSKIIEQYADELNAEAEDALDYQIGL